MSQRNLSNGFRFGIALFAVIGLVFLGTAAVTAFGALRSYHEAEQYQKDGQCRGTGDLASQSSSCRQETAIVLGKSQRIVKTRHRPWHIFTLALRRSDGKVVSESLVEQDLWQSLAVGGSVSATVWRGKITGLAANGFTSNTSDEPGNASLMGIAAVGPLGLGVIFCVVMIRLLKTVGTA